MALANASYSFLVTVANRVIANGNEHHCSVI